MRIRDRRVPAILAIPLGIVACAARETTSGVRTARARDDAGLVVPKVPDASLRSGPDDGATIAIQVPLPPLPASSLTTASTRYVPPLPAPPSPCPRDMGWDGHACVTMTCIAGSIFRTGSGCVTCVDECDPNPWWPERAPWGNNPAPFNRDAVSEALSKVVLSGCKRTDGPTGTGIAEITFLPSGSVFRIVIDGQGYAGTAVSQCVEQKIRSMRVPEFGGFPVTVAKPFAVN